MFTLFTFIILALSPEELLSKVDSVAIFPHSIGVMEETIITTTGKKRTFLSLIHISEPTRRS